MVQKPSLNSMFPMKLSIDEDHVPSRTYRKASIDLEACYCKIMRNRVARGFYRGVKPGESCSAGLTHLEKELCRPEIDALTVLGLHELLSFGRHKSEAAKDRYTLAIRELAGLVNRSGMPNKDSLETFYRMHDYVYPGGYPLDFFCDLKSFDDMALPKEKGLLTSAARSVLDITSGQSQGSTIKRLVRDYRKYHKLVFCIDGLGFALHEEVYKGLQDFEPFLEKRGLLAPGASLWNLVEFEDALFGR